MKLIPDLNAKLLPDDFPVFYGHYYLGDGELYISHLNATVAELKDELKVQEIREAVCGVR